MLNALFGSRDNPSSAYPPVSPRKGASTPSAPLSSSPQKTATSHSSVRAADLPAPTPPQYSPGRSVPGQPPSPRPGNRAPAELPPGSGLSAPLPPPPAPPRTTNATGAPQALPPPPPPPELPRSNPGAPLAPVSPRPSALRAVVQVTGFQKQAGPVSSSLEVKGDQLTISSSGKTENIDLASCELEEAAEDGVLHVSGNGQLFSIQFPNEAARKAWLDGARTFVPTRPSLGAAHMRGSRAATARMAIGTRRKEDPAGQPAFASAEALVLAAHDDPTKLAQLCEHLRRVPSDRPAISKSTDVFHQMVNGAARGELDWQEHIDIESVFPERTQIDKGAGGVIWKAVGVYRGRRITVAVKEVTDESLGLREAALMSLLDHMPGLIPLIGLGRINNDGLCLVLPFYDSGHLGKYVQRTADIGIKLVMIRQIACALASLHQFNCLHRDIKPENIFVGFSCDDGGQTIQLKLADFGISNVETEAPGSRMTRGKMGTPVFMVYTTGKTSKDSDVFSFGILMWMIIASNLDPLPGVRLFEAESAVVAGRRPKLHPHWAAWVSDLLTRCWSTLPKQRPTCLEIRDLIDKRSREVALSVVVADDTSVNYSLFHSLRYSEHSLLWLEQSKHQVQAFLLRTVKWLMRQTNHAELEPKLRACAYSLLLYDDANPLSALTDIATLWAEPLVRRVYQDRSQHGGEGVELRAGGYFLSNLERICAPRYMPTFEDHARLPREILLADPPPMSLTIDHRDISFQLWEDPDLPFPESISLLALHVSLANPSAARRRIERISGSLTRMCPVLVLFTESSSEAVQAALGCFTARELKDAGADNSKKPPAARLCQAFLWLLSKRRQRAPAQPLYRDIAKLSELSGIRSFLSAPLHEALVKDVLDLY